MALPVWLFWELSDSINKDDVKQRTAIYEATSLAFGSYQKSTAKGIHRRWAETLEKGYDRIKPVKPIEQRKKEWAGMAGWFG